MPAAVAASIIPTLIPWRTGICLNTPFMIHTNGQLPEYDRFQIGIFPGSVRISVGLEDITDIKEDIRQALEQL